ncbi:hypothetical protein [uncultured Microscilla sp.]|uniref:hypothetical protein n=1 Tax=uncultured Microscilla sp. TaxID=432653 RepID=UPI00261C6297|nr:hypothetical protein [uncultured Microscilla sp.]
MKKLLILSLLCWWGSGAFAQVSDYTLYTIETQHNNTKKTLTYMPGVTTTTSTSSAQWLPRNSQANDMNQYLIFKPKNDGSMYIFSALDPTMCLAIHTSVDGPSGSAYHAVDFRKFDETSSEERKTWKFLVLPKGQSYYDLPSSTNSEMADKLGAAIVTSLPISNKYWYLKLAGNLLEVYSHYKSDDSDGTVGVNFTFFINKVTTPGKF